LADSGGGASDDAGEEDGGIAGNDAGNVGMGHWFADLMPI
jgi:hypothetical protein